MTTFFAMCYIMVLNGVIIGGLWPAGTGLSKNAVFFATTLTAGLFTFMMGLIVNVPVALAPGMGLNGYFATVAQACADNPNGHASGMLRVEALPLSVRLPYIYCPRRTQVRGLG